MALDPGVMAVRGDATRSLDVVDPALAGGVGVVGSSGVMGGAAVARWREANVMGHFHE